MRSLGRGLVKAGKEAEAAKVQAQSKLSSGQFCKIEAKIRETTKRIKRKEQVRSAQKIKSIKRREANCNKHVICRWVRAYLRDRENRNSTDNGEEEIDNRSGDINVEGEEIEQDIVKQARQEKENLLKEIE